MIFSRSILDLFYPLTDCLHLLHHVWVQLRSIDCGGDKLGWVSGVVIFICLTCSSHLLTKSDGDELRGLLNFKFIPGVLLGSYDSEQWTFIRRLCIQNSCYYMLIPHDNQSIEQRSATITIEFTLKFSTWLAQIFYLNFKCKYLVVKNLLKWLELFCPHPLLMMTNVSGVTQL